ELPFPITGETIVPGWSKGEEPELTPFTLEETSPPPAPEQGAAEVEPFSFEAFDFNAEQAEGTAASLDEGGVDQAMAAEVQPFSFDDFDFDTKPVEHKGSGKAQGVAADVQPFSFDDLGLGELGAADAASRELGLTPEELAGLDLGDFETLIDPSQTTPLVSEDPEEAFERLMNLGRQQGYVDLTDMIRIVSDPEAEAERIEEMGWALHNAGIQIRDGDEIIDMEGESEEEEAGELSAAAPTGAQPALEGEPDLTPFSLNELGLSEAEIADLGLSEVLPTELASTPVEEEPALTPFSLTDLGLNPEEIALLEGAASAETMTPASTSPTPEEPEMTPFSLADLGLSPEEIALLEGAAAEETTTPASPPPAPTPPPSAPEEPELTPFSLADLGLSPEEIALLEGAASEVTTTPASETPTPEPPPSAPEEPALTPFSLADLGLSPEEIALLEGTISVESVAPEVDSAAEDLFDFGAPAEQPVAKVTKRTEPRREEPPPPVDPTDAEFKPEALDNLDDIWDAAPPIPPPVVPVTTTTTIPPVVPATSPTPATKSATVARVVLPPLSERRREPPPKVTSARTPTGQRGGLSRDDERFARREELVQRSRAEERFTRRDRHEAAIWREAPAEPPTRPLVREFAGFLPTGDPVLDDYLGQLDSEPENFGLALAIGRLCAQTGRTAIMALAFKRLVRAGEGIEVLAEEIEGLLSATEDQSVRQQLYRLLGDTYSKQGRYREAMSAYGTTFGR
ncbi:MAG: RNA polymerase sigma factor region1.1 domain-containing protein, partial [Chloroflexales bacterium]